MSNLLEFDLEIDFWKNKYLIGRDVLNPESEGLAQSYKNVLKTNCNFQMLITLEQKVPCGVRCISK